MAALQGKLLFCDDDTEHGIILNDSLVKKFSESKIMSARHPYGKNKFPFRSLILPIILCNHFPGTNDLSHGMIRRIHVIPFSRKFLDHEDDKQLFPKIWEIEMPGILNKAIQGLQRVLARGDFHEPLDCIAARKDFFGHAHPLYNFLSSCLQPAPEAEMNVKTLRESYVAWAKEQGFVIKVHPKRFVRTLRDLEGEFDFKVTEPKNMDKTAYPKIYGVSLIQDPPKE